MPSLQLLVLLWLWCCLLGIREQLSLVNIPKGMQGMAIALVTAGLLAMAFMGFSGVDKGLGVLFGIE